MEKNGRSYFRDCKSCSAYNVSVFISFLELMVFLFKNTLPPLHSFSFSRFFIDIAGQLALQQLQ